MGHIKRRIYEKQGSYHLSMNQRRYKQRDKSRLYAIQREGSVFEAPAGSLPIFFMLSPAPATSAQGFYGKKEKHAARTHINET